MKKIIAMVLAVVVFAAGFGAGNIYRSICKAAESKSGAVSENGTEVLDQTEQNSDSNGMAEPESETQSETVAVGLESTLLSEKVYRNSTGTRLTDFEIMEQYPELPTGCEITAMTMVLNYYGYNVDKVTMALDYMPKIQAEFYRGEDGRLMGPDLENFFVGDPTEETGYICGTGAIVTAANAYLTDVGSDMTAVAMKNAQPEELYDLIDQGTPVVIWCTINMEDRAETDSWYREDGTYMEWSTNDHGAVLIGYDEDTVTVADPIYSRITVSRVQFEKIFAERGGQCVILTE
ncbi:MAG: C39 family peptidase [Lachnospiraceae bacterium]|nr:C39 family peptidase [Lachnospiraceae bacterium]MDD7436444.1 C39 family peptidase [Lachnospiraceae bacterium]MDY3342710.1 C39 family peptidase [Lachnospiraceae bacterium]